MMQGKIIKSVDDRIVELGLPKNTQFLGFVVHLIESDEFLVVHESNNYSAKWGWSPSPEGAIQYKTYQEAQSVIIEHGKGAMAPMLFDLGNRYMVDLDSCDI